MAIGPMHQTRSCKRIEDVILDLKKPCYSFCVIYFIIKYVYGK